MLKETKQIASYLYFWAILKINEMKNFQWNIWNLQNVVKNYSDSWKNFGEKIPTNF